MVWGHRGVSLVLCAGAALSLARDAAAQSKDEAAARALFDEARQLRESGQYALACPKLEEAKRLFTSAGLVFNLADCYEKVGRTIEARSMFDEASRVAGESGRSDLAIEAARRRDAVKASDSPPHQAPPALPPLESVPPTTDGSSSSRNEQIARALFEEGRALRDSGRTADACLKFEASSKRFTSAGVVFNLGDCYARLGRTASAWTALRTCAVLAQQTNRPDMAAQATLRANELEPTLMRLTIHAPHATVGQLLRRDTVYVGREAWDAAIAVDPGVHEVRAEAPGYEPWSSSTSVLAPGETVSIEVPALRPVPAEPAPTPVAQSPTKPESPGGSKTPANANATTSQSPAMAQSSASSPAPREAAQAPWLEHGWLDADVGGAYADVTLFNASTLSLERTGRAGPTFSFGAGFRLDSLTLGVRVRDLDLSAYNVWEVDGEGALHDRFDRFDAHVGFRGGYAALIGPGGIGGLNVGAFFGFDYYASALVSLGIDVYPEVLWLQGEGQASLGFAFGGVARLGLHF
jgi:tetratricopeptide (TPR) repeat protein